MAAKRMKIDEDEYKLKLREDLVPAPESKSKELPEPAKKIGLKEFLRQLEPLIKRGSSPEDSPEIHQLMSSIDFTDKDFAQYTFFSEEHYTRNLVASKDFVYDLILLCWAPKQKSAVHDHKESGCWMRVLQGELTEHRYQVADDRCILESSEKFESPGTFYINNSMGVHAVANTGDQPALSLHLYSPPITECKVWLNPESAACIFKTSLHSIFGMRLPQHMYKPAPSARMGGKYWPLRPAGACKGKKGDKGADKEEVIGRKRGRDEEEEEQQEGVEGAEATEKGAQ
jgi:cysteine dioxygenase